MRKTLLVLALFGLASCGETMGEQAIAGAAVGAATAAVVDGNMAAGAAVGAAGNIIACQSKPELC